MLRKAVLWTIALGISGSTFLGTGFCQQNAKAQKPVEKAIRKYHRLLENGKEEKAARLAEATAKTHPQSPAAQLLMKYSELLANSPGGRLTDAAASKASNAKDTLITAEITIVEVPETFFERLGIDFDDGHPAAKPIGIDVRAIPQPDPSEPPRLQLVAAEEVEARAILSPLETLFFQRALRQADCQVVSRPTVRTHPNQTAKVEINGQDENLAMELVAKVSQDGKHLALDIEGKSQDHEAQVQESLPLGSTLLMSLGTRVIEARVEHAPPVVSRVPYVSRLFKNTGIGREVRHRLVFITPRIVKEPKSYPAALPVRN